VTYGTFGNGHSGSREITGQVRKESTAANCKSFLQVTW